MSTLQFSAKNEIKKTQGTRLNPSNKTKNMISERANILGVGISVVNIKMTLDIAGFAVPDAALLVRPGFLRALGLKRYEPDNSEVLNP